MSQMTFGDAEYAGKRKKTRREVFLEEMEQVIPWRSLLNLIEPFYPLAGRGRHPYPLETMLRVHLMQNWFGLSDPAIEEALYEITPLRAFARLSLTKPIPDETTILHFRHLLEEYELAPEILRRVNAYLSRKGLLLKRGSIVDATIIAAPSSTIQPPLKSLQVVAQPDRTHPRRRHHDGALPEPVGYPHLTVGRLFQCERYHRRLDARVGTVLQVRLLREISANDASSPVS